ncbi:hypothetical protein BAUCODRAFT_416684 [Baudoinia panamericana UAMH 10762]|uniref:Alkyl transferase n=1 Tax=Baudoinia panamericana (strain UAMH 10762) TaxID=717646 RepID=M2LUG0_BAUPA|nr:uncharacterized protein BAUCODRAFT_416684 [Baudoinia panamericana UAMH 10762]EMC98217.1 hypothetical protein BAUCODRAFT_416684 [Baudoinia panamericana UAMH 10762]
MSSTYGTHLRRWLLGLPPVEWAVQQIRGLLISTLKCGPIPQHIAFVMDGNRRYARQNSLETVEGHHMGFEALARILEVCYKSGVRVVTIYAFSIENFKRSRYEVDGLMDMAKTRLVQMSQHGELFERYGARVRILGDLSLVREDVMEQLDRAAEMTKHHDRAVLNVCFPYTSRDEITRSIRETVREYSTPSQRAAGRGGFSESHRTSGVYRLSDFMLWQCHEDTEIRFVDVLWPQFSLTTFMPILLEWQWRQRRKASDESRQGVLKVQ